MSVGHKSLKKPPRLINTRSLLCKAVGVAFAKLQSSANIGGLVKKGVLSTSLMLRK